MHIYIYIYTGQGPGSRPSPPMVIPPARPPVVWCGMVRLVWFDRLKRDMQQQGVFTVASNVYDMKHMFFQGIVAMIAFHYILRCFCCIYWNQALLCFHVLACQYVWSHETFLACADKHCHWTQRTRSATVFRSARAQEGVYHGGGGFGGPSTLAHI